RPLRVRAFGARQVSRMSAAAPAELKLYRTARRAQAHARAPSPLQLRHDCLDRPQAVALWVRPSGQGAEECRRWSCVQSLRGPSLPQLLFCSPPVAAVEAAEAAERRPAPR